LNDLQANFLGWGRADVIKDVSRMIQREGGECRGMRQGRILCSTLGQVKHVDFYPVDTHYVLYCEGSKE